MSALHKQTPVFQGEELGKAAGTPFHGFPKMEVSALHSSVSTSDFPVVDLIQTVPFCSLCVSPFTGASVGAGWQAELGTAEQLVLGRFRDPCGFWGLYRQPPALSTDYLLLFCKEVDPHRFQKSNEQVGFLGDLLRK